MRKQLISKNVLYTALFLGIFSLNILTACAVPGYTYDVDTYFHIDGHISNWDKESFRLDDGENVKLYTYAGLIKYEFHFNEAFSSTYIYFQFEMKGTHATKIHFDIYYTDGTKDTHYVKEGTRIIQSKYPNRDINYIYIHKSLLGYFEMNIDYLYA